MTSVLARAGKTGIGLGLGGLTALLDLVVVAVGLLARPPRRALDAAISLERKRIGRWFGEVTAPTALPPPRQMGYLAGRVLPGAVGGIILGLIVLGFGYAVTLVYAWVTGTRWVADDEAATIDGTVIALLTVPGVLLLALACAGCALVARWERSLLRRLDSPSAAELVGRVSVLTESREAVIAAVDDERRRIERDLHDGVQQRLVALGMLLGRARRRADKGDSAAALELVDQAYQEAQHALTELRDVSWRVYPAALDDQGLAAALEAVAERAPLPVRITCDLPTEPPAAPRAVAWFVVCEAVTNAAKHADASEVTVDVRLSDRTLRALVRDDGRGGADPSGIGLSGLARRAASVDGTLRVTSPPGGPTIVEVELPCA